MTLHQRQERTGSSSLLRANGACDAQRSFLYACVWPRTRQGAARQAEVVGMTDSRKRTGGLRPVDFDALKATVSIVELLDSIGWKPVRTRRGGNELRGPCPIHNSSSVTSLIFSVTPSRNIFKCFKCDAAGDTIALAAYLFSIPRDQRVKAAVQLCKHLGIEIPRLG